MTAAEVPVDAGDGGQPQDDTRRLDRLLVELGLARSRGQAAELIALGRVRVDGQPARKPAQLVAGTQQLVVDEDHYVSRAAHKLIGALADSGTTVPGRVLDAGASTGGFTQVLLEQGAKRVYAVDVGQGQLAPQLRDDPRVQVREKTNLRYLGLADLEGQPVELIVADVSFISLKLLVGPLSTVLSPGGTALLLVKPQFEVGRQGLDSHGRVIDAGLRRQAVEQVIAAAQAVGWNCDYQGESPLKGTHGNSEYFVRFR